MKFMKGSILYKFNFLAATKYFDIIISIKFYNFPFTKNNLNKIPN